MAEIPTITFKMKATGRSLERVQDLILATRRQIADLQSTVADLEEAMSDVSFVVEKATEGDAETNTDDPPKK